MPIYTYKCEECGQEQDRYEVTFHGAPVEWDCHCGGRMPRIIAASAPALYFEEGRGRWIENLGPEPVFVTSAKQHQALMKKNGVTFATKDDLLHNQTRRALDARKSQPTALAEAFKRVKESL